MATFTIRDATVELVSANPQLNIGFGKYLKNLPATLLAATEVSSQFTKDLALVNPGESGIGLKFAQPLNLGDDKPRLNVAVGARATIGVFNKTGMLLFDETFIGQPLKVAPGQAFVAFSFHPSLAVSMNGASGHLGFGFQAGTEAEIRCYRPFDTASNSIKLADACKQLFENFSIPNDAADLESMGDLPEGSVAVVSGSGKLSVSASFDFATAFNPLAALNSVPKIGKVSVGGGASLTAGVSVSVFGEFQTRVQTLAGRRLRLSYHKMRGGEIGFSMDASAGASITAGDKELLALLFKGEPKLAGGDEESLVAAGITKQQLTDLRAAIRIGMSRKLNIELAAAFSSLKQTDSAFEYEIDLAALDAAGRNALNDALSGNLATLNAMEDTPGAHGIKVTKSLLQTLRKRTIRWRLNLVGLLNVLSVSELVRTGTIFQDDESGELVISDETSAKRIKATSAKGKIRKTLCESLILTITYKAAGIDINSDLHASQSFFVFDRRSNRQEVSDYLDAISGLGLMNPADISSTLDGIDDFGAASLLLDTAFDKAACERVFLDNGQPRSLDTYEAIGKQALLALISKTDPDSYRRLPAEDDSLWREMKDKGQFNLQFVLPAAIAHNPVRLGVVINDYSLIVWWAKAMSEASEKLADMLNFLNGRDAATLKNDATFKRKCEDLAKELSETIQANKSNFDDPWGLLALYLASRNAATASALLVSPKLTLSLP